MKQLNGVIRKVDVRNAARLAGEKTFIFSCAKHGQSVVHYTTSGRCKHCTSAAKDPERQREYWALNGKKYGAPYRAALRERHQSKAS